MAVNEDEAFQIRGLLFMASLPRLQAVLQRSGVKVEGEIETLSRIDAVKIVDEWFVSELSNDEKGQTAISMIKATFDSSTKKVDIKMEAGTSSLVKDEEVKSHRTVYHKEFKINGSVEHQKGISFLSVVRQIERGKKKGFTDLEVTDAVIKAVPVGSGLRNYLEGRADLDLPRLRPILRAHYKEKNPTELFNMLSQMVQQQKEDPSDFLLRALELRQKVMFTSLEDKAGMGDQNLVDRLFCRTVYTGLKSDIIRTEMKPFLEKDQVNDEELIQHMSVLSMREEEMNTKLKTKNVDENVVETFNKDDQSEVKARKEVKDGIMVTEMKQLRAEVALLKEAVQRNQSEPSATMPYTPRQQSGGHGQCKACKDKDMRCTHCWICGSEDHFKAGCKKLRTPRNQSSSEAGKGNGSRLRD